MKDPEPEGELLEDLDNNPYTTHRKVDGEIVVSYDYSEVYDKLDLSKYSGHGRFAEDGIMWVKMSDYTGTKYGYIDYNGNFIVPLSEEISGASNFYNGLAIVYFSESLRYFGVIINTKGESISFFEYYAVSKWNYLNNGNIYFTDVAVEGKYDYDACMFCKETGEFVVMPYPGRSSIGSIDYSDGLLLVYSKSGDYSITGYFDSQGNCVIDLNNSNQYYKWVKYAERFRKGEATVTFVGLDEEWYKVKINKKGEWISEPEQISEYDAKTFNNSTY